MACVAGAVGAFCASPASAQQVDILSLAVQSPPAQQPPPTSTPPPASGATPPPANGGAQARDGKKPSAEPPNTTSKDRLFFVLPNFLTVQNAKDAQPLTTAQKYAVVAEGSFDVVEFPWYALTAGISQANNSEPGYGRGVEGYAKRYGAAFADGTSENFMVGAIVPSLLKEARVTSRWATAECAGAGTP